MSQLILIVMSLKSNLLSRIGKKGEEVAAQEAVEIAVMQNAADWNAEVAQMNVALLQAKSALRAAESQTVSASDYVELQREVKALEADIAAVRSAYESRFTEEA